MTNAEAFDEIVRVITQMSSALADGVPDSEVQRIVEEFLIPWELRPEFVALASIVVKTWVERRQEA